MFNPVALFVKELASVPKPPFVSLELKQYAGVSFLYVHGNISRSDFERFLHEKAKRFIQDTAWQYEFDFIRQARTASVYRFRLRVPDEKSFCCGNECPHCILYRDQKI